MNVEEFIANNNIKRVYSYLEQDKGDTSIEYGWVESNSLVEGEDVIISYHSRTKNSTASEKEWSKDEGTNVVSVSDYNKFFAASTGFSPSEFIELHSSDPEGLVNTWESKYPGEGEVLSFMHRFAHLLENKKKFVHFGRGFKIVTV